MPQAVEPQGPTREKRSAAEELMDTLSKTGRKKHRAVDDGTLEPYTKASRWITRGIDPFVNLTTMFAVGIASETGGIDDGLLQQMSEEDRDHYQEVYRKVLARIPELDDMMNTLINDNKGLSRLTSAMMKIAGSTRSDDAGSIRYACLNYVMEDTNVPLQPTIPKQTNKADRGFNHPVLAELLCPRSLLDSYKEDEDNIRAKIQDGRVEIVAEDWPAYLYETGVYDPDEIDKGLLRGTYLLRVFRHIFTGPSTAFRIGAGNSASTRASNAKLHGMERVTPETIAYAAVQARFGISNQETWGIHDGKFDYKAYWKAIVALFDDDKDSGDNWAAETLAWWNKNVFGINTAASNRAANPAAPPRETARARMLAQRQARRERARHPSRSSSP